MARNKMETVKAEVTITIEFDPDLPGTRDEALRFAKEILSRGTSISTGFSVATIKGGKLLTK